MEQLKYFIIYYIIYIIMINITANKIFKSNVNLVPRAFPFLSLGRREKALAPGGLLCILIGQ
jgi:hypothetical protein